MVGNDELDPSQGPPESTSSLDDYLSSITDTVGQLLKEPYAEEKDAQRVKDIESLLGRMVKDPRIIDLLKARKKHLEDKDFFEIPLIMKEGAPLLSLDDKGKIRLYGPDRKRPQVFTLCQIDREESDKRKRVYKSDDLSAQKVAVEGDGTIKMGAFLQMDYYVGDILFHNFDDSMAKRFLANNFRKFAYGDPDLTGVTAKNIEETAVGQIQEMVRTMTGSSTPLPPTPAANRPAGPAEGF